MSEAGKRIDKTARAFLEASSEIERPAHGKVADLMENRPMKGLDVLMCMLGEVIAEHSDPAIYNAHSNLVEHLRGGAGDSVLAVAFPQGESAHMHAQALRERFIYNNEPIFDEVVRLLRDLELNKGIEIEDHREENIGSNQGEDDEKPSTGWRASLYDEIDGSVSDRNIGELAQRDDENNRRATDKEIEQSAKNDIPYHDSDDHHSVYEHAENEMSRDLVYNNDLCAADLEIKAAHKIALELKQAFDKTLGASIKFGREIT